MIFSARDLALVDEFLGVEMTTRIPSSSRECVRADVARYLENVDDVSDRSRCASLWHFDMPAGLKTSDEEIPGLRFGLVTSSTIDVASSLTSIFVFASRISRVCSGRQTQECHFRFLSTISADLWLFKLKDTITTRNVDVISLNILMYSPKECGYVRFRN